MLGIGVVSDCRVPITLLLVVRSGIVLVVPSIDGSQEHLIQAMDLTFDSEGMANYLPVPV